MPDMLFRDKKTEIVLKGINILEPNTDLIYTENSNVIIRTDAAEENTGILKVEFFVDGSSIGYNTVYPFNWAWFNARKGMHQIKVLAVNSRGDEISKSIEIKVVPNRKK